MVISDSSSGGSVSGKEKVPYWLLKVRAGQFGMMGGQEGGW